MKAALAAQRLDDASFPHGTPAGYRDGCRGNGGCPNHGTELMTCKEASTRYSRDLAYRRAYDSGDIWLNRAEPRDPEAERVRTAVARRSQHQRGIASDPTPGAVPEADLALERLARESAADDTADDPAPPAAAPASTRPAIAETAELATAMREIARLRTALEHATAGELRACDLARLAAQERATAIAAREAALDELEGVRATLAQTIADRRRLSPGYRPRAEFYAIGDQLHVGLNVLIDQSTVKQLLKQVCETWP